MSATNTADKILYGRLRRSKSVAATPESAGTPRITKLSSNFERLDLTRWIAGVYGFCGGRSWIAAGDFPSASWTEAPDQKADADNMSFYHELIAALRAARDAGPLGTPLVWEQQPRRQRREGGPLRRGYSVDGRPGDRTANAESLEAAVRIYSKNPRVDLVSEPERWYLIAGPDGSRWAVGYSGDEPIAALRCDS